MKYHIYIFFLIIISTACDQKKEASTQFNLDFEQIESGFPSAWERTGDLIIDSTTIKSGKYSALFEFEGKSAELNVLSFTLPDNYDGKKITLSGYIKTENVAGGYAGLWMKIDPGIAYDDMSTKKLVGTTDWTKYEITLDMSPVETKNIVIGGILEGNGKAWFDDLEVTIDGTPIQYLKPYKAKHFPAEQDHKFDKGSNIVFSELNDQKISDLELLGRVWGFLKYHHPTIGQGKYSWDYELFRILPSYLRASNNEKRDWILQKWIGKYGNIPTCKTCEEMPEDAFLKPDLSWIDNSNMNQKLKSLLYNIYINRYQGNHFYIRMATMIGNPIFLNENAYSEMPYPDAGFRLLALYRYWNMIHYFYPNKYMTDKNWDNVLKEYILPFVDAKNELEYELIVTQIIGEVCDTHAGLWDGGDKIDSLRGSWIAPVQIQLIENKFVVTGYYEYPNYDNDKFKKQIGLKIGDIITHIDGKSVEFITDSIKKYYPASNEAARMRNIARDLLRSNNYSISVNYISSEQIKQTNLILYKREDLIFQSLSQQEKPVSQTLSGNITYLYLGSSIGGNVPDKIEGKGMIIDLRCYPSGQKVKGYWNYLQLYPRPTEFVKFTYGSILNPGLFTFIKEPKVGVENPDYYKGKKVILVNELSQSHAEFMAMKYRCAPNTIIIGSTTAGADGNVSKIELPGGLWTWISGIGVYYPDGKETQRIGIVPDIEIKPTIQGIKDGRDEVLEKAIEIIEQGKN